MLSAVLRTIREHRLIVAGDRILVGVSGGPDSTALLHALVTLASRLEFDVQAACVDHGLRPESAAEATAVARDWQTKGICCDVVSVNVAAAKKAHASLQGAARDARLEALKALAGERRLTKIALGHTADDQAETVLFRTLRGTGIAGLAGIPYRRDLFIRPLLDVRRAQILAFLHKRNISFVTDPSNANRRFARARIRHDILPLLARENPRVVDALLGLAREARRQVRFEWRRGLPSELYLPTRVANVIDRLVREPSGTQTVSVAGGEVLVTYGRVSFMPRALSVAEPVTVDGSMNQAMNATIDAVVEQAGPFRVRSAPAPAILLANTRHAQGQSPATFDSGSVHWPLEVRAIRPGDRMVPRGGRGSRKLSDLLIDAKIPRRERSLLPVLCDARGTILFVPGLRPSECARPTDETRDALEVRVLR